MKLEVRELSVHYGAAAVLENIDFILQAGEKVAVLGPNGAGKSTLLKAISGLVNATGRVVLEDSDGGGNCGCASSSPGARDRREFQATVAYLPQDGLARTGLTVLEAVLLGRHESLGWRVSDAELRKAREKLERLRIEHLGHRTLDTLSGGQRQLAGLAQALYRAPRILLLDEPTSALDLFRQMLVLDDLGELAREEGMTVLLVMHDVSLAARFADRILFLKGGRLIADDQSEVVLTSEMVGEVYNIEAEVLRGSNGSLHVAPVRPLENAIGEGVA